MDCARCPKGDGAQAACFQSQIESGIAIHITQQWKIFLMYTHVMVFPATGKTHTMVTMKNTADFKDSAHPYHQKNPSDATVNIYMILLMSETTF